MSDNRKIELLCAVIGRIGTDDREDTKTIRNPTPALFAARFPATFPGVAVYTEWVGVGRWELVAQITENGDPRRMIHLDSRPALDFPPNGAVRLVLDWGEVEFRNPGPHYLMFYDRSTGEPLQGRGFHVVRGSAPVMRHPPVS